MLVRPRRWRTLAGVVLAVLLTPVAHPVLGGPAAAAETHVLTVTVSGADGPVTGDVEIGLYRWLDGQLVGFADAAASSGRASFTVPAGAFRIQAKELGREPAHLPEFHPDSTAIEDAADVAVESDRTVDVVLDPRPVISGRVTDSTGVPLPDVPIDVYFGTTSLRTRYTDAQGRYSLIGEPGGWAFSYRASPAYVSKMYVPVTVGRTDLDLGDQVLLRPSRLSGPLVVDPPVSDPEQVIGIRLLDDQGRIVATGRGASLAGRWTAGGLAPGTYRVYAETAGHAPIYHGGEDFAHAVPVEVGPEADVEGPALHLDPLPPGVPDGVDISGVVRDSEGRPLAGVSVRGQNFTTPFSPDGAGTAGRDITDELGRYFLTDVRRAEHNPEVFAVEFGATSADPTRPQTRVRWSGGATRPQDVAPVRVFPTGVAHEDAVLAFHSGLRGTIRAAAGTVLLGEVMALRPDGSVAQQVEIREDGTYVLDRLDADVPYRIRVDAAGRGPDGTLTQFATAWRGAPPALPAGTFVDDVDVVVTTGGVPEPRPDGRGRVLGQLTRDGAPAPVGSWVSVYTVADDGTVRPWQPVTPEVERADGVFSFLLDPGTYFIQGVGSAAYQHEYYEDAVMREDAAEVVVGDGGVTLRPIDLSPRASLSGRVLDPAGTPLEGVKVSVRSEGDSALRGVATTDRDGRFAATIGAGDWLVRFFDPRFRHLPEWYAGVTGSATETPPDGTTRVPVRRDDVDLGDIDLAPAGTITGAVDWDLDFLESIDVDLYDLAGNRVPDVHGSVSSAGGTYTLRLVPPGRYVVGFKDSHWDMDSDGDREEATLRELYPGAHTWAEAQPVVVVGRETTAGIDAHLASRQRPDPASVEIAGTVTDGAGRPEAGVWVTATSRETAPYQHHRVSRTYTDVDGRYEITDLDPSADQSGEYVVKIDQNPAADRDRGVVTRWSPGVEREEESGTVIVPASGSVTFDATVRRRGGIAITAEGATEPDSDRDTWTTMSVVDLQGQVVAQSFSRHYPGRWSDVFEVAGVVPGQYLVRLDGGDFATTWWPGVRSIDDAEPVTVPDGGIDRSLSIAIGGPGTGPTPHPEPGPLAPRAEPRVTGSWTAGRTITVTSGTWSLPDVDEEVEWLSGGTTIARGRRLLLTPDLAGSRLRARVIATHAPSAQRVVTDLGPGRVERLDLRLRVRARTDARRHVVLLAALDVRSLPGTRWSGPVSVHEGGRTLLTRRLDPGRRQNRLALGKVAPGRHVYRVRYPGSAEARARTARVVVSVGTPQRADRAVV